VRYTLTFEERQMQVSLREFLAGGLDLAGYEAICATETGFDAACWNRLAGSGWLDVVAMTGDEGEVSAWPISGVFMAEEYGRTLLPAPVELVSGFLLPILHRLDGFGPTLTAPTFVDDLPAVAAAPALSLLHGGAPAPDVTARREPDGAVTLTGRLSAVAFGASARWLYLPAFDGTTWIFARVPLDQLGVSVIATTSVDPGRRTATITLADVPVGAEHLANAGRAGEPIADLLRDAAISYLLFLDGKAVGAAQSLLERTVSYVAQRHQFGVPIGSFQALKHRIADMATAVESARSLASYTAWKVSQGHTDRVEAVLASRIHCAEAYRTVCESAIQCHGGMGFTWEQGLHWWYKSALFDAATDAVRLADLARLLHKASA